MNRYRSHPSCSLLLLISIFTFLSFRSLQSSSPRRRAVDDAVLRELAAVDPAADAVRKAAKELLAANFSSAPDEYRAVALRELQDWLDGQRFDPSVMAELVDLIKRPIDRYSGIPDDAAGRKYASCAVVGNSGILLKSHHGALIDSHDMVIRLNNAPIGSARYASHVGERTGLAFLNSNVLRHCTRRRRRPTCQYCRMYGDAVPIVTYMCNAVHFVEHAICNNGTSGAAAPVIVTDPRLDMLCSRIVKYYSLRRFARETARRPEEWKEHHEEGMFHYSSGMQAVVVAAGMCERVSLFGFGKLAVARHHYHTTQRAELDLHDYEAEYEFYSELAVQQRSVPFLRDAGFTLPPVVFYR